MKTVVIATIRPWNVARARAWKAPRGYKKVVITRKEDFTYKRLRKLQPEYVFFPHWSWIIPEDIWRNFECVVFHMTDLPFGRGGSPLQNLLLREIYHTKVSAIQVEAGLDTGSIYLKRPLDISKGSAVELYERLSRIVFAMISEIIRHRPRALPQHGGPVIFARRTPAESRIPRGLGLRQLYDFIRMLDAPEYPRAFLEEGVARFEFHSAKLEGKRLTVSIDIRKSL